MSATTKKQIMQSALSILKDSGFDGLTMRKVATVSGRSLNNVQHHYKTKKILLNGMANYYFSEVNTLLENYEENNVKTEPKNDIYKLVLFWLESADSISDSCLIFREMWAISSRDEDIELELIKYYTFLEKKLVNFWREYDKAQAHKAAAILIPYADGYSIQHKSLTLSKMEIVELLSNIIYKILIGE